MFIDLKFYDKFVAYLQTKPNPSRERVGLLNDSIGKFIANIKTFMQWSLDREYHSNLVFKKKDFKVSKAVRNDIVTLTEEEVSLIYNLDLSPKPHLERVRDLFIFALYTGQRWGDYEKYRREEIHENEWHFEQEKTGVYMRLPLTGFSYPALKILIKYNYQLPKMTQQHFNDEIKTIGKLAGINTPTIIRRKIGSKLIERDEPKYNFMSSHMARRTCITLLLEKGVPATTVMKLSGHTDIRTMMKYENTSSNALKKSLNQISIGVSTLKVV